MQQSMEFILSLISLPADIQLPSSIGDWVVLIALAGLVGVLQFLGYGYNNFSRKNHSQNWLLLVLVLITPIASLFFGLRLILFNPLTLPNLPAELSGAPAMFFAALPWMVAAGTLGPIAAAVLAAFGGLLTALYSSHSLLTPLYLAFLATVFSLIVRQRYRTNFYRLARSPLFAALLLLILFPVAWLLFLPLAIDGSYIIRLDFTLSWMRSYWTAYAIELVIAALITQGIAILRPGFWGGQPPYYPSPAEKSIQARLLFRLAPLALLLILAVFAGSWLIAVSTARSLLTSQMTSIAEIISGSVPFFRYSGEGLIKQMAADSRLTTDEPAGLDSVLSELIKRGSFFSQLTLFTPDASRLASYPDNKDAPSLSPSDEQLAIQFALTGVPINIISFSPEENSQGAGLAFVVPVEDMQGNVKRVLIGNVTLENNPLTEPLLKNFAQLEELGLEAAIFEAKNDTIVLHSNPEQVMGKYNGPIGVESGLLNDIGPDGRRRLIYFLPLLGEDWSAAIIAPAAVIQQLSMKIAAPMMALVAIAALLSYLILHYGLGNLRAELNDLSSDVDRIAKGRLDQPVDGAGVDEVGQLRQSFETMRQNLKARMDELSRLLQVTQGVASNLDLDDAIRPVLESALASGASMARVVLLAAAVPDLDNQASKLLSFNAGPAKDLYHDLDEQLLGLTRQQNRVVLANLSRLRLLNLDPTQPHPGSLLACALRHEDEFYGTLWVGYDQQHMFSEEETRYISTLANQVALAAANARSYLNAEIGRQRLAAILSSSPDPILVTDQHNRLILANPAARLLLGLGIETEIGQPVDQVIQQKLLLDLLRDPRAEKQSLEISFSKGQIYLAAVSNVIAEGQKVGRVCVLRDVTRFKELDTLKSEFVATVSHDLRTPLTLIRGNATMLEMVGPLNEQQTGYARKIISGAEQMSRLVNNLLDLGRIEAGGQLNIEELSAYELAARVIAGLQVQANQKKIQLRLVQTQQSSPMFEADAALIQQALHNLVENAIKYNRNDGRVTVLVNPQEERIVFEVSDTGTGISPMDQARLFEKFYHTRQQPGKEQSGSGLGLAIVRSVAEKHGGQVWVESQLGKGSTFYLAIPLLLTKK